MLPVIFRFEISLTLKVVLKALVQLNHRGCAVINVFKT